MKSVRVGFIGVGGIAGVHLKVLSEMPAVEISALCDIDPERLKRRGEEYPSARLFTDYREMLDSVTMEAIYVCVPPFAHGTIEEEVAQRGLHLFIEKPVELHLDAAKRKAEAIAKVGILASVGYCARYTEVADIAKDRLRDKVVELALGYFMGGPGGGWWALKDKSGGQLVEQTTHMVDLARYFLGEVEAVYGAFTRLTIPFENFTIDNASVITLHFKSGAIGAITSACHIRQGHKTGLDLFARDYSLEYTYSSLRIRWPGGEEKFQNQNDMYLAEDEAFIQAIQTHNPSLIRSPYEDAVKTLEVTLEAYRSAEEKRAITLSSS